MQTQEKEVVYYDMVVRCKLPTTNEQGETIEEEKDFLFDYVEDNTIQMTSDITSHPLVNGDIIADHMYINPITESFSGTFSLRGNKKYDFGGADRLSVIQETFERIKNEGILCTLVKMSQTGDESRFKVRENMVLNSITWIEKQVSLDFSFTFTEVLTAVVDDVEYDVDVTDETRPLISDPLSLDVTEELLDYNEILQCVLAILHEEDLMAEGFLEDAMNAASELGQKMGYAVQGQLAGIAAGAVAGSVAASAGIVALVSVCAIIGVSVPVAGWIAVAVVAAVCIIAGAIWGIFKGLERNKYQIKRFKFYKDTKRNKEKREAEQKRFYEFLGKIYLQFEQLEDCMSMYGFGVNSPQQCVVTIDNNYYLFTFSQNSKDSPYSLTVREYSGGMTDETIRIITNIEEMYISSLSDCNSQNLLFTTPSGNQVYLSNKEVLKAIQSGKKSNDIKQLEQDLRTYAIISSTIDLKKFNDVMTDIIKSCIFK